MDAALEALWTARGDLGIYNLHGTDRGKGPGIVVTRKRSNQGGSLEAAAPWSRAHVSVGSCVETRKEGRDKDDLHLSWESCTYRNTADWRP